MNLQAGEQIDGYTVLQKLGHGGMSEVYHAEDTQHSRQVVLKFPHEDMMGDPATYERFRREVKIGTILTHPNIQKLYELKGDTRAPYLVLEYVEGQTLREVLRHEHRLGDDRTRQIGVQLGEALSYAHTSHVFHRDLKPENIIITHDGQAKVMDFGIGFVEGARRITWGSLSSQVGTPDYMAPEQIKGVRGDARTDIYALGTILYECLAGCLPYSGDNPLVIMNQHVTMSPPPIHQWYQHVAPALEEVVMKALRRDPQGRWPSMQAFTAALKDPEAVDMAALQSERTTQEHAEMSGKVLEEFGLPLWQVILIVVAILLALVVIGILAQLVHRS